jgi:putrescine aminotransferase
MMDRHVLHHHGHFDRRSRVRVRAVIASEAGRRAAREETVEDYKRYVNPPLARVMKLSGAPVEVHASGCVVTTADGAEYLDFAGGYGVFTLGHAHPRVTAAVHAQLDRMAMSTRTMFNPLMGRLARRLAELTPGDLQISFFSNSGTEAVEAALKLARAASGRTRIVATENAYHGKTFGALTASGREAFKAAFAPLVPEVTHVPFGDLAALAAALPDAAAFIVEPVQAEGGVVLPPAGYLAAARALCTKHGALFIADEVQTGLGRCGTMFACEEEGVVPDVLVLAKGLSGGIVPIGATVARADVWNAAYGRAPLLHTSTFGGNELACAAALAALDVLVDDALVERSRIAGERLLSGARAIAARYPDVVAEVRGRGLLVGVELRREGYGGAVVAEMLKRRVTAAWTLNMQSVIRLEPPFVVTDAQIDAALTALDGALAASFASLGRLS